jgi:hypothetical protein
MNKKMKAALRKLVGDDDTLFDSIVATVDDVNRSATGMINREKPGEGAKPKTPAPAAAAAQAPVVRELTDADIDTLVTSDKFITGVTNLCTEVCKQMMMDMESRANSDDEEEDAEEPAPLHLNRIEPSWMPLRN